MCTGLSTSGITPHFSLQECSKPQEAYGFEQAKTIYSLREFGMMADRFKEEYFGVPAHVSCCLLENRIRAEFRIKAALS